MARVRRELRASSAGRDGADAMRIEATDVVDAVEELTMAAASPRAQGGKKADVTSAARSPATMVSSGLWTTLWGRRLSLRLVSSPRASTSLSTSSSSTHSTYSTSSSSTSIPTQPVVLDLSLARGLDYYTGLIYEAALLNTHSGGTLGSVAAGGRYDDLVSSLSSFSVPCVGLSLGLERLVTAISDSVAAPRLSHTEVVVASAEKGFLEHRVELLTQLWDANIKADTLYTRDPRLLSQLRRCEQQAVPLVVIVGGREAAGGSVTLRDVATRAQVEVSRGDLIAEIKRRLANRDPSHATPRDPS
ncbi:unnamed protein product [Lampetra fluviatilis]